MLFQTSSCDIQSLRDTPLDFQGVGSFVWVNFLFHRSTRAEFFFPHVHEGDFFISENFNKKKFSWRQG